MAESRQSLIQVGFMRRFDPALEQLRGLIGSGALGRVDTVRVASHDHEPPSEQYAAGSGGIFRDQLIHDFDMIRWVTQSEVSWVFAAGAIRALSFLERYGDVDTTVLAFGLSSGPLGVLTGTREDGRGEDVRIEAIGSADSASAGLNARTPLRLCDPLGVSDELAPYTDARDRFADAYAAELRHFLTAAEAGGESACTPRDALGTLLVAVACEQSLAANAPVTVTHAAEPVQHDVAGPQSGAGESGTVSVYRAGPAAIRRRASSTDPRAGWKRSIHHVAPACA